MSQPMPPRSQRMPFESRIMLGALGVAVPSTLALVIALFVLEVSLVDALAIAAAVLLPTLVLALRLRGNVAYPLYTVSNLLEALREGDYSLRGSRARRGDAIGEVVWEVNALSRTLREQRLKVEETVALLSKVLQTIDIAILAFDGSQRLRLVNPAGERLLGVAHGAAIGASAQSLALDDCLALNNATTLRRAFPGGSGPFDVRRAGFREGGLPHDLLVITDLSRALREEERAARGAWTEDIVREEAVRGVYQNAGAASRDEIADRRATAEAALGIVVRELETLESTDPFFATTRSIEDPIERGRRLQDEFETERTRLEAERRDAERAESKERDLLRELAGLEGRPAPNVAQLELSIRAGEAELSRLRRERDATSLAFRWVEEAARQYQGGYREELEQRVSSYFELFTGTPGRRLRLDEKFRVQAVDPDGQVLTPAQLSQGAHDQLFLAIRLAVADLLSGTVELPLFFDDPFLHFDAERQARLRAALDRLSERRQWILLTHREEFRDWGAPVERVQS
jgi:PAS domain-containing protein